MTTTNNNTTGNPELDLALQEFYNNTGTSLGGTPPPQSLNYSSPILKGQVVINDGGVPTSLPPIGQGEWVNTPTLHEGGEIVSLPVEGSNNNIPTIPDVNPPSVQNTPVASNNLQQGQQVVDGQPLTNNQQSQQQTTIDKTRELTDNIPIVNQLNYNKNVDTPQAILAKMQNNAVGLAIPMHSFSNPYQPLRTGNYALDTLSIAPALNPNYLATKGVQRIGTSLASGIPLAMEYRRGMDKAIEQQIAKWTGNELAVNEMGQDPRYQFFKKTNQDINDTLRPIGQAYSEGSNFFDSLGKATVKTLEQADKTFFEGNPLQPSHVAQMMFDIASGDRNLIDSDIQESLYRWANQGDVVALDAATTLAPGVKALTSAKVIGKVGTTTEAVDKLVKMGRVDQAANLLETVSKSKAAVYLEPAYQKFEKIVNKVTNNPKGINLEKVLQSIEEGGTAALTKTEKEVKGLLKQASEKYNDILEALGIAEDNRQMAIAQYIVRKEGVTFDTAKKMITSFFENPENYSSKRTVTYTDGLKYITDKISEITGLSPNKVTTKLLKKTEKLADNPAEGARGLWTKDRISINKKDRNWKSTLGHEWCHELLNLVTEEAKKGNAKAIAFMDDFQESVLKGIYGDKAKGKSANIEDATYAFEHFFFGKEFKNIIGGVNPKSQAFLDAVNFWKRQATKVEEVAEKGITPQGLDKLKKAPKGSVAELVAKANDLYDKGEIFPITHANAGWKRLTQEGKTKGIDRNFWGSKSERVNGQATYKEMAEEFLNPASVTDFLSNDIINTLNKQTIEGMGATVRVGEGTKYISKVDLLNSKVDDLLDLATDQRINPDDIPIDSKFLQKLIDQRSLMRNEGNPYNPKSFLSTAYKFNKSMLLGSGKYLVGNATSAAFNSLLHSGGRLFRDAVDTIKTKGELSRLTGTSRPIKPTDLPFQNKLLNKTDSLVNKPIRDAFNRIDVAIQNYTAEMAINNELARKGVPVSQRAEVIENMSPTDLYELIRTAQDTSMLNTSFSLVPKSARGAVATVSPFYRWGDTATRSSVGTFLRNPFRTNLVLNHFFGDLVFDKEMQWRAGVNADMDKPFVHIHYNPETGMYRDQSSETSPQITGLKLAHGVRESVEKRNLTPLLESQGLREIQPLGYGAVNFLQGKDEYGNPIRRNFDSNGNEVIIDKDKGKRYAFDPATGNFREIGMQMDEVIPSIIRQTIAPVKFYNQTLLPATQVGLDELGLKLPLIKPSGQGIFSSLDINAPNINPNNVITPDVSAVNLLGTYSTSEYMYPNNYNNLTPNQIKQMMKLRGRTMTRQEFNKYFYGGGR